MYVAVKGGERAIDNAHAWLADEPFMKVGLYSSITVHAFANLWPQKAGFPPEAQA